MTCTKNADCNKRETTFWQGVACGMAVAIAILLTVIVRLM